jgi:hypothetical protein
MPANYGLIVNRGEKDELKTISIQSKTTICVVLNETLEPVLYRSLKAKLFSLIDEEDKKNSKEKAIYSETVKILKDIYMQGVDCPLILMGKESESIKTIQKIRKLPTIVTPINGVRSSPDLILVAEGVDLELVKNSEDIRKIRGFVVYDDNRKGSEVKNTSTLTTDTPKTPKSTRNTNSETPQNNTTSETITPTVKNTVSEDSTLKTSLGFDCERAIPCWPKVKNFDGEIRNLSSFVVGLIASTDGRWEHGYADSFSNREIKGVASLANPVEFSFGEECEADDLRAANITTVINVNGAFRTWGGNTYTKHKFWRSMQRLRIFDKVIDATIVGVFDAIDKRADILRSAKHNIEQLLLSLKGFGVLLGNEIEWNEEKNTKEELLNGRFYLDVHMQNTPIVERLEITFSPTDRYKDVLMEMIK